MKVTDEAIEHLKITRRQTRANIQVLEKRNRDLLEHVANNVVDIEAALVLINSINHTLFAIEGSTCE